MTPHQRYGISNQWQLYCLSKSLSQQRKLQSFTLLTLCEGNRTPAQRTSYAGSMMMSSNGNIFRVTGHLCGEFTGLRWIPRTKASAAGFDVFFDLRLNKRLSKQSWGWWLETLSCSLWRQSNAGPYHVHDVIVFLQFQPESSTRSRRYFREKYSLRWQYNF